MVVTGQSEKVKLSPLLCRPLLTAAESGPPLHPLLAMPVNESLEGDEGK